MKSSIEQMHQWVSDLGPDALSAFNTHCRSGTSATWLANWVKRNGGPASAAEDVRGYREWLRTGGYGPPGEVRGTATS